MDIDQHDNRELQAMMESFRSRLVINALIALFILVVPLLSGNPITWWNIAGAIAVIIVTVLTRNWYSSKNTRGNEQRRGRDGRP